MYVPFVPMAGSECVTRPAGPRATGRIVISPAWGSIRQREPLIIGCCQSIWPVFAPLIVLEEEGIRGNGATWKHRLSCDATDVEMAKMCLNASNLLFSSSAGLHLSINTYLQKLELQLKSKHGVLYNEYFVDFYTFWYITYTFTCVCFCCVFCY